MKKTYQNIILIFIATIVIMLPFMINSYPVNDDTNFHVANISATIETMTDYAPKQISPFIAKSFGYATRQFYPVLPHTTAAYVSKTTGLDVINSLKITHFFVLFASGVAMFFLSKRLSKSNKVALLSAIIYEAFPYHLSDIYIRDAFAECFLFVFLPIILLSLTYVFENKKRFYLLFIFGYCGGMLSHLTMMVYFTALLIPFFIVNRKEIFKKEIILRFIIVSIAVLLIVSPMLSYMFQNKLFGDYMVFVPEHMAQGIWHSGLYLHLINYFGIFNNVLNTDATSIKVYFNIISLILLVITIKKRQQIKEFGNYKFIIIFGLIALFLSSILFPWDLLPNAFRMLQFPWRCMTFVAIAVALIAPLCIEKICFKSNYLILTVLIVLLSFFDTMPIYFQNRNIVDLNNIDYSDGQGWQKEYFPRKTYDNFSYYENRSDDIITSNGSVAVDSNSLEELDFTVNTKAIVEFPRLYYFGYVLKNTDGVKYDLTISDYGFLQASVDEGSYTLKFVGTIYYNVAKIVSATTIGVIIIYTIFKKEKKADG